MDDIQYFFANLSTNLGLAPGVLGRIIGAILLLIVGYFVAKLVSGLVRKGIHATGVQRRIYRDPNAKSVDIGKLVGKLVYYILMVIVLIGVLDILGVESALRPLENLVDGFFDFLPNLIGAAVIAFAGYVIAKLAGELVALAVAGVEGLSERFGLTDRIDWANLARQVVFILVFIPILIAAIDVLGLETISRPLTRVLQDVLAAIPKVLAAGVVLAVFYYLAKFISGFVRSLVAGVNADAFVKNMGLSNVIGRASLPAILGGVVFFFIMFSGVITAVNILDFDQLAMLLNEMFEITLQIIFGLVILVIGNVVANFAYNAVRSSQDSDFLASIARFAVLGLFIAIALKAMGIADDIVNLAFGLTLGALAVAFALSFGLGGREAAGKQMEAFLSRFREESKGGGNSGPKPTPSLSDVSRPAVKTETKVIPPSGSTPPPPTPPRA